MSNSSGIRVEFLGPNIHINRQQKASFSNTETFRHLLPIDKHFPSIHVFEDGTETASYLIEPKEKAASLKGRYFELCVRITEKKGVLIDGVLKNQPEDHFEIFDPHFEGIRLQPFFLKSSPVQNESLFGRGLFERGLHFAGTVTPGTVRCVAVCDHCRKSFTLRHYHAGFSEIQYFYSANGLKAVSMSYEKMGDFPGQLAGLPNETQLKRIAARLPKNRPEGAYGYFNPLRCKHCHAPYIDFSKYPEIRPSEYYVYFYLYDDVEALN